MENKVKIIADSLCDISAPVAKKYGIEIHPFIVNLGDESFLDDVTINTFDIYKYYKATGMISKTAASSPEEYSKLFKKWTDEGYDVLFFTIGKEFSSAYTHARIGGEDNDKVHIIETGSLSSGISLLILAAADIIAEGASIDEAIAAVNALVPKVRATFVIDTLEFLWKGGRCSGVAALGANLLKLKPCIEVVDGKMEVGKKYRGTIDKVIPKYISERLESTPNVVKRRAFITHSVSDANVVKEAIKQVKATGMFDEIIETKAGCAIYSHCGPNTLGVLYIEQ